MDIIPTLTMYRDTSKEFATKYMWWFFLIQKEPLPEHMIGCDPEFFLDKHFEMQNGTPGAITPEAMGEYRRCFCNSDAIHASCEDYRAAAAIDLEMDEADEKADRKVEAPLPEVTPGADGVRIDINTHMSRPLAWIVPSPLMGEDLNKPYGRWPEEV